MSYVTVKLLSRLFQTLQFQEFSAVNLNYVINLVHESSNERTFFDDILGKQRSCSGLFCLYPSTQINAISKYDIWCQHMKSMKIRCIYWFPIKIKISHPFRNLFIHLQKLTIQKWSWIYQIKKITFVLKSTTASSSGKSISNTSSNSFNSSGCFCSSINTDSWKQSEIYKYFFDRWNLARNRLRMRELFTN